MAAAAPDGLMSQTDPFTLPAWIMTEQRKLAPAARGNLTMLLNAICVGCKFVSHAVRRAGVAGNDVLGAAGSSNVQGEDQKKLDLVANEVFKNVLRKSGQCCVLVTEEEEDPVFIAPPHRGEYVVVFDPLDGSSNIDCGVSIGTIFGVYKADAASVAAGGSLADALRPGRDMVAAGYAMYGSMTALVVTLGAGAAGFTLDDSIGEFILTHPRLEVPPKGKIYSINEGNCANWDAATRAFVDEQKAVANGGKGAASLRYVGSMVADVHRTLLYGGIFMYPADAKNPAGKLRLLYECFPMAMLLEQAGGAASTGTQRVLDVVPAGPHGRGPIYLGSREDVARVEALYREHGAKK